MESSQRWDSNLLEPPVCFTWNTVWPIPSLLNTPHEHMNPGIAGVHVLGEERRKRRESVFIPPYAPGSHLCDMKCPNERIFPAQNAVVFWGEAIPDFNQNVRIFYRPLEGKPRDLPF